MTIEHVVVPVEPCRYVGPELPAASCAKDPWDEPCRGCVGDGRRALLDQTVAVERMKFTVQGQVVDISTVWVES